MKEHLRIKYFRQALWLVHAMILGCMTLSSCYVPESSLADKQNFTKEDQQYKKRYAIDFEENEVPERFWYHYVVSKFPGGYRVRILHPDRKTLIEKRTYSTPALTLLHGPYESYWDDGSIRAIGQFQYGRRHGSWVECEPGKGKSTSGTYLNDKKEGVWTQLDTNGLKESEYAWLDGIRHGKFFEFDTSGQKINEGIYRADTLISELFKKPRLEQPFLKNCREIYEVNVYACTESALRQQVYSLLRYPPTARQMGIEGAVLIQWEIRADGSVDNLRVPQALSDEIEKECLRVLRIMPEWFPARLNGKDTKYTMSLPINFQL